MEQSILCRRPPSIMDLTSESSQSVITCRNSQGTELTANLLRIKRYSVVFEVYNPYSILQLSEVLSDFRIMASRRLLYHGKAVVSNLLNTGIVLVCEAMLDEGWVEVDFLSSVTGSSTPSGSSDLCGQFGNFMGEWKSANKVQDPFKLVVADLASMFSGVQHWLTGVDVGIRTTVTLGTSFGCPFEGAVDPGRVLELAGRFEHFLG